MGHRIQLGVVSVAVALSSRAPAHADPVAHHPARTAEASSWSVAYRRACRSYAPPRDPVFEGHGRSVAWCLGTFSVDDGRYLGASRFDLDPPRVFLSDGREIVAHETTDDHWAVTVRSAHGRHHDPVATSLTELRAVVLSVRGESALVTRADGRRAVVAVPSGRTVLPLAADGGELRSARSPDGTRLALAGPSSVVMYDVSGAAPRRMASLPEHRAAVAFTDDGRTLLVARGDGTMLTAWREGAHEPPPLPVVSDYANTPDARVYATEASEFAAYAGRTSGWARAVMERYGDGGFDPTSLRVWRLAGGSRAAEWRTRRTPSARPAFTTVRVHESGIVLYREETDDAADAGHARTR